MLTCREMAGGLARLVKAPALANYKSCELGHSVSFCALYFLDMAMHPFFNCGNKGDDLFASTFQLKQHPAVGLILHKTAHFKLSGQLECDIPESYALHPAGKVNGRMFYAKHDYDN